MPRLRKAGSRERYPLDRSPFAQRPTQRDLAELLRETKDSLQTLATPRFKERFLVRRPIESGGKTRNLVYPEARLRGVHERLKFQLAKIVQPSYLMSPRVGKAQRDNAEAHVNAAEYLTLDIKQFYPSTTRGMIRNALVGQFGMAADVAGLIAHLATADDRACFGSPLTPVLASIVHRPMFDAIANLCAEYDLSYTVWVDDLTISGDCIPGEFRAMIRAVVSKSGLRSHKLRMRTGNRVVFITGVGVVGSELVVPRRLELRSKELWDEFKAAETFDALDVAATRLLAHLGGIRHVVGKSSQRGRKLADEMNSVRQKREKSLRANVARLTAEMSGLRYLTDEEKEKRKEEIAAIPF